MRLTRTSMIVVLFALAPATRLATAKDGRDFAGQYSLTKTGEQGDQVRVTMVLHLMNYSGADLDLALIAVHPSRPGLEDPGDFAPVRNWRKDRDVVVGRELSVPRDEYQRWLTRSQPNVFVVYTDARGQERRGWVQLSRRPLIREALPVGPELPARRWN